jgi:arsenate reductase (glutaredoxin)
LIKKAGLRPIDVVRRRELKVLGLSDDASDGQLIKAMVENPDLLQRPIVEVGERAVLARPAEKALELINT